MAPRKRTLRRREVAGLIFIQQAISAASTPLNPSVNNICGVISA
ncbi:hypothetical protein ECW26_04730 [Escherichia coli W26]|nr:hypothetical protein ECW26_04730 [Escherichia coli W26]